MKIELKNIKISAHLSEETTAFTADLFVNGKKVGYAKNQGFGGPTDYDALQGCEAVIKQAEKYCEGLPNSKEFDLPMNLELFIELELYKFQDAKEAARFEKKMQKDMLNSILAGKKSSGRLTEYRRWPLKFPIEVMKRSPQQFQAMVANVRAQLKDGEVILNTNI